MKATPEFIQGLPVAELHLHIEGSLEPELMFELAQRNGVAIPFKSVEEVRAAYNFTDLQSFLDIYYQGMNVLQTEADFYDLTSEYMARIAADNVMHTEIFFDPQGHTERGVSFDTALNGIVRALKDGEKQWGISSEIIMCFLRHLDEKSAFATLQQAMPHKDKIIGVGLDSSELGHPPSKFARVFAAAKEAGFKTVMHAGEEGPPEYVTEALDIGVDRIDHGNRSLEDPAVVSRLFSARMPLTVCPLSNVKLCNVDDIRNHPIRTMLAQGLIATVNSDDPSYFGGYVKDNFSAVVNAVGLTQEEAVTLARNSIEASFASEARKAEMRGRLYSYAAA